MAVESEIVRRRIRELRVVDLRNELENRGLDKNGVKATLVDRLIKVTFSLLVTRSYQFSCPLCDIFVARGESEIMLMDGCKSIQKCGWCPLENL